MLTARERFAGYRRAIRDAGPDAESVAELFGPYSVEFGRLASERLITANSGATGFFFGCEEALLGALETFSRRGIRVPDDASVVAFDDVGPLQFFSPPVTAHQPTASGDGSARSSCGAARQNERTERCSSSGFR